MAWNMILPWILLWLILAFPAGNLELFNVKSESLFVHSNFSIICAAWIASGHVLFASACHRRFSAHDTSYEKILWTLCRSKKKGNFWKAKSKNLFLFVRIDPTVWKGSCIYSQ